MLKNILTLEGVSQLSKEEQKNVNGGLMAPGTCAFYGGTSGDGEPIGMAGVSMADAQAGAAAVGGHWCCSSCKTASWYSSLVY